MGNNLCDITYNIYVTEKLGKFHFAPTILWRIRRKPPKFWSQRFVFSSLFPFLPLFLHRSTHSSWSLLRRQSRAWLNRSGSLPALCLCVCFLMQLCTYKRSDKEHFISGHMERQQWPLALASFSHPPPLPRLLPYLCTSHLPVLTCIYLAFSPRSS